MPTRWPGCKPRLMPTVLLTWPRWWGATPMSEAKTSREFVGGLSEHIDRYLAGTHDVDTVLRGLGCAVAHILSSVIREGHLLSDEAELVVDQFCDTLWHVTMDV